MRDKLRNEISATITIQPLLSGGDSREAINGFYMMMQADGVSLAVDFRQMSHAIIPICSTSEIEMLLIVRPRKLTEIERAKLQRETVRMMREIK